MKNLNLAAWGLAMIVSLGGCQTMTVAPADAWVQRLSTGYRFTEGPAYDGKGGLYFTDIPNERIIRYDTATGQEQVVRENSGRANGLMFDPAGRLTICEGGNRRVTRIEKDGSTTVLAAYAPFGNRLNSPNDLAIRSDGGIYFTDPRYGKRDDMELAVEAVYFISPQGKLSQVIGDLQRPNGLILSPDQRTLYVADHAAKNIWAYSVKADGSLANPRVFATMDPAHKGGGDGMTIDRAGNVYCAGQGHIWIWNSRGELLNRIAVPEEPANCTFGGPDRRDLYITARTSLYRVRLNARGLN